MEIELVQLRRFMAIVETGAFVHAAARLNITQQALSASMARMEEAAGVRFLERRRGSAVELTAYGRLLAARAGTNLALSDRLSSEIGLLREARGGAISVGLGEAMTGRAVAEGLRRFQLSRPDVQLRLVEGYTESFLPALIDGEYDVVFGSLSHEPADRRQLQIRPLFQAPDVIAVRGGHPLAALETVGLADLARYPWLVPGFRGDALKAVQAAYARRQLRPPTSIVRSDAATIGAWLCLDGDYVLATPSDLIALHVEAGRLVTLAPVDAQPFIVRDACAITRRGGQLTPVAETLVAEILAAVGADRTS